MIAILSSQHQEVARVNVEDIEWIDAMGWDNPNAEDLIKVSLTDLSVHWCDGIEFIMEEEK